MYSDDGLLGSDAVWFGRYLSTLKKKTVLQLTQLHSVRVQKGIISKRRSLKR